MAGFPNKGAVMKKLVFLTIVLISSMITLASETISFSLNNREINVTREEKGVRVIQADSYYSGYKADPSIPIFSHYFEIPEFTQIESVTIQANNLKNITLDKPLLQQPEQFIMSKTDNINTEAQVYKAGQFPQSWLFNSGSSIAGSKNIAFIAVYACSYNQEDNSLEIPNDFTIKVSLTSAPKAKTLPDSRITREIQKQLNLPTTREYEQETYLLIYPQIYETSYLPLIDLREKQGLNVHTATTEMIYNFYDGIDNAEKIRNFIIDKYNILGIDYVTFGADVEYIPERRLWAFDCNYGIEDENNIPGDIYYANLNGDWNANQNDLFGEDDDELDLFPEVIIARLPARNSDEIESMVDKLIAYEIGYHQDHSQGLGLSSNLWEESNSVYTQEYIEDMYYPDYINNVILNEEANSVANAQTNFNRNPNIIQHTGHCFWNVIALGSGTINPTFVDNMTNDYAGVMYSIGCWAAALDFDAIAEKLVRVPEHGLSSFVGNSRYGWGAPSADGFGFSEFYQKEFARLLFSQQVTSIAMANQLSKIPFVAYQNGDSVYKWCSYQLNTIGDSYYHLFIEEPKIFEVDYSNEGDNYSLFITNEQEPVEGVVVTLNDDYFLVSDNNGFVSFISEPSTLISLYKEGYQMRQLLLETNNTSCITEYQIPEIVAPMTERTISFKVRNSFDIDLNWQLRVKEGDTLLGETSGVLNADVISDWTEVTFDQPESNILTLELYSNTTNTILDTKLINVVLAKPEVEITSFNLASYPLAINLENYFSYTIKNTSNYTINQILTEYNSDELEFPLITNQRISLEPGEEISILNEEFALMEEFDFAALKLTFTLSNDYWQEQSQEFTYYLSVAVQSLSETFEEEATWFEESAWQRTDFYAYEGNYSLTCSPETYGEFDLDLPLLTYTDEITLSFMYKYKMPMYGQDGFSIYVITDDIQERIIFLGSGGALDNESKDPDDFIFGDWAEYSLNLGDLLLNKPEIGSQFILRFSFTYIEDSSIINDYSNIDDLGVFLDNMQLTHNGIAVTNEQNAESLTNHISLYPNPINNSLLSLQHNSKVGQHYEVSIYNLKGQKLASYKSTIKSMDKESIQLPIFQKNRDKLTSGIYFVKYKTVDTSVMKKILFLK